MTNYRISQADLLRLSVLAATNPDAGEDEVMGILRAAEPITVVEAGYIEAAHLTADQIYAGNETADQVHGLPVAKPE